VGITTMTRPAQLKVVRDYLLLRALDSPVIRWAATVGPPDPHRTMIDLTLRWFNGEDVRVASAEAVLRWPDHEGLELTYGMCHSGLPSIVLECELRYDIGFREDVTRRAMQALRRQH